jgi:hypothetical protein
MEQRDDQAPFPREPWQRLLAESAGEPPETTDARIRAAARRDLVSRGRRWWLPASLAASLVLAVMIVHSEFGATRRPVLTESAASGDSAIDARLIERSAGPEARESGESPAAAPSAAPARKAAAQEEYGDLDAETGTEHAGVGPRVGGPEHQLRAASELPGEATTDADTAEAPGIRMDAPAPRAEPAAPSAARTTEMRAKAEEPVPPSPEAWYAEIRRLFAAGRRDEAGRELERLRKAYPEWAAKNVKTEDLR